MAGLKTRATEASAAKFVAAIEDEGRRRDCRALLKMMKRATRAEPKMWGSSIVGFGSVRLKYDSGRELDWFKLGFASRKQDLTLYGLQIATSPLLSKLGRHGSGKGYLYIKRLADVDTAVLQQMMNQAARRK